MDRKTYLDSLKGIAVCGIVMIHTCVATFEAPLGNIIAIGRHFVTLFFLISSYLLFDSYEKYIKKIEFNQKTSAKKWWLKKYINLMPLYYMILIVNIFLGGKEYWLGTEGKITGLNVIFHMLFLHGLNPYYANSIIGEEWYLADLAIFILLTPFLYKIINSLEKSIVFLVVTSIGAYWISDYILGHIPAYDANIFSAYFGTFWFVAQIPSLAMGILIYHLRKGIHRKKHRLLSEKVLAGTLFLFGIYMIIGEMYGMNKLYGMSDITLYTLWFGIMIISMEIHSNKIIDNVIFRELGKKSYTIYLIQFLIIEAYDRITKLPGNTPKEWFCKWIVVLIIAYLFSVVIEKLITKPICDRLIRKVI